MENRLHIIVFEQHSILYGCSGKGKFMVDLCCISSLNHKRSYAEQDGLTFIKLNVILISIR